MYLINKERKNLMRRGRTWWLLLMAYLIPFGVFYFLFNFTGEIIKSEFEEGNKRKYKIAWVSKGKQAQKLRDRLEVHLRVQLVDGMEEADLLEAVKNDSVSVGIVIAEDFDSALVQQKKAGVTLYYDGSSFYGGGGKALSIVEKTISNYRKEITNNRIKELNLPETTLVPIEVTERSLQNMQQQIEEAFSILRRSVATLVTILLLVFGGMGARFALRALFWEELEGGQTAWAFGTSVSKKALFSTKILIAALYSWKLMFLSLLGFASALSFEQLGILENLMVELRSLLGWGNLGLLSLSAMPLAMLFVGYWGFWMFWTSKRWGGFWSNVSMLVLLLLFIMSAIPTEYTLTMAVFPFVNIVFTSVALLSKTFTSSFFIVGTLAGFCWALLFLWLGFRKFQEYKPKVEK